MARNARNYCKVEEPLSSFNVCIERFQKACEDLDNHRLTFDNQHTMIIDGRFIVNSLLDTYMKSSDTKILLKFLEICMIISPLYPNRNSLEDMSKNELTLIRDKCKYFIQLIYVLFHLNRFDLIEKEMTEYKDHLQIFGKHIRMEFEGMFRNIEELLHSFKCLSIYHEKRGLLNIFNRMGFQDYENMSCWHTGEKRLNRAIIIGSCATQVALKRTTIDMFRMSQAIEFKVTQPQRNARKWMFYDTNFWEVEIGITDALHSISKNGIMLLYISGDMYEKKNVNSKTKNKLYQFGVKMKQEADENVEHPKVECLYPGDLAGSLVVPMVVVVDSECSQSFLELDRSTDEPFLCLLSPSKYPDFVEQRNSGKLFTLFLTSPQTAFALICHKKSLQEPIWTELLKIMNEFMATMLRIVDKWLRKVATNKLRHFMADPFCRAFLLRYMFCMVTLRLHNEFPDDSYYPRSNVSALEREALACGPLQSAVYKMASIIRATECFAVSHDLSSSNESIDVEI